MKVIKRKATGLMAEMIANLDPARYARTKNKMILAAKIADAMHEKGLSQKQMAEQMEKNESEISEWLSGDRNFTVDTLTDIETFLGVRLLDTHMMGAIVSSQFIHFNAKKNASFVDRESQWSLGNNSYMENSKAS